jgi:hypothetical protein
MLCWRRGRPAAAVWGRNAERRRGQFFHVVTKPKTSAQLATSSYNAGLGHKKKECSSKKKRKAKDETERNKQPRKPKKYEDSIQDYKRRLASTISSQAMNELGTPIARSATSNLRSRHTKR